MKTFAFQSVAKDGYIKIPEEYRNELTSTIKVFVVPQGRQRQKSDAFPYLGIDMSGYTFDREEANER
jgi:hypothetical protein